MNLLEAPGVGSAFLFIGEVHIGARALHVLNLIHVIYGLAISLAYPSGEEGGNFLVQMIFTCRPYV
jgi:hypothetical protein